jgi:hypothetical protein
MTAPRARSCQPKLLGAGGLQPEIGSFRLHLAAEGKAATTVRTYVEAVQWFAAAHLIAKADHATWEDVGKRDVQEWVARLLGRYSDAYASNQFRAVRRFLKWLACEEDRPDPTARLRAPVPKRKLVPVFHQRRTFGAAPGEPGQELRRPSRRSDHRRVPGDRHPAVRAREDPVPARRLRAQ